MKKLAFLAFVVFSFGFLGLAQEAMAEEGAKSDEMVTVFQCPMDGYIVAAKCPHCNMKMEQKEMRASEVQAAMDAAKKKMKGL